MNFYKHHLGDYAKDTAHLGWLEDCAYRRMLDCYYGREAALPVDRAAIYRLVRASTAAERRAVDTILAEFFVEQLDGWHNKRGDIEVAQYQHQASTNRRIARERIVTRTVDESLNEPSHDSSQTRSPNQNQNQNQSTSKALSATADGAFAKFWDLYPRKTARKKALDAFKRSRIENGLLETVLKSVEGHKATEQWQRGVIPHAATWLNQRRWEDQPAEGATRQGHLDFSGIRAFVEGGGNDQK